MANIETQLSSCTSGGHTAGFTAQPVKFRWSFPNIHSDEAGPLTDKLM